jgi:hypothetical protein
MGKRRSTASARPTAWLSLGPDTMRMEETTLAFTFNLDAVGGTQGLFSRDATFYNGDGNHLSIYVQNGTLAVRMQDGGSQRVIDLRDIQAGQDYHVALSFGDGTGILYVDGQEIGSVPTGLNWATSPEYIQIGALGWNSATGADDHRHVLDGEIRDLAIYDDILGDTEIAALAGGAPVPPAQPAPIPPTIAEESSEPPVLEVPVEQPPTEPAPTEPDPVDPPAQPAPESSPTTGGSTAGAADWTGSEAPEHGLVTPLTNGLDVVAGRVTTLEHHGGEIDSIRITDLPQFGNITVNADNTMALVLSQTQQTGQISFGYEVTYTNGSSETVQKSVDVVSGSQDLGWGPGKYYMLEEGQDGSMVVEHGDVHREVYISESNDALSAADIAQMAGTSANNITGAWLANNPQFGSDPSTALQPDIGMKLWKELTENKDTSHWLLFESGYEYSVADLGSIVSNGSSGESELHPLYIGSYGEGARPILNAELKMFDSKGPFENIVFQGVTLGDGARVHTGENILFDDVRFEEMLDAQNMHGLTVHDSVFLDITKDNPSNGHTWDGMPDRMQGMYVHNTHGLLLDGILVDQVGWEDDYRFDKSGDGGQAPSIYSHNIYIQYTSSDVTMRDSISMRAASFGAQMRAGGLIEDNVFLDNNGAFNTLGGASRLGGEKPIGNYSLLNGNLVTSGAHKTSEGFTGGLTMGINNKGQDTALVDNIVTHLADPNNLQEQAAKTITHNPLDHGQTPYYDDTIIYKWIGGVQTDASQNAGTNIGGLDPDQLDETTIQRFAADLLGNPNATIADLGDYLRGISEGTIDAELTADDILAYFQSGFGIYEGERTEPTTVRFTPDDRADGIRWDNKLNWNTGDRPMDGDNVDLASNWVNYTGTHKIDELFMGDNGRLEIVSGRLDLQGELHGGASLISTWTAAGSPIPASSTGFWTCTSPMVRRFWALTTR